VGISTRTRTTISTEPNVMPAIIRFDLQGYVDWFEEFVSGFTVPAPEIQENFELKREHSLKVMEEASLIVRESGLDEQGGRVALIAALFHDLGRFPQYLRYKTFRDADSEDHARLGLRSIRNSDVLVRLGVQERKEVHQAILLHNRRTLPHVVAGRARTICQVVRDADKLDILRVLLTHLEPNGKRNSVVTLGLAHDAVEYSPGMVESLRSGQMARYEDMVWENDFTILLLSWIYDFNFQITCRMFLSRGYLDRLMALLPQKNVFTDLHQGLSRELHSRG
jgi:hypothetical protein